MQATRRRPGGLGQLAPARVIGRQHVQRVYDGAGGEQPQHLGGALPARRAGHHHGLAFPVLRHDVLLLRPWRRRHRPSAHGR
ncbi:Uncharacterised protein [Bordetella pertussis]|nr:Uncharacterised protein [Bordetella pertussis]